MNRYQHPTVPELTKPYLDKIRFDLDGPVNQFHWEERTLGFGVQISPEGAVTFIVSGAVKTHRPSRSATSICASPVWASGSAK